MRVTRLRTSVCTAVLLLSSPAAFGANVVSDWNAIMLVTVSDQNPFAQARFAAITQLAVFEAMNAITGDYTPYLGTIAAPPGASQEAATVAAAHRVLATYFPGNAASLDAARVNSLSMIADGTAKLNGIAVGEAAAMAMITLRADDGSGTPMPYTPLSGPGFWQPTPPAFGPAILLHWSKITPFAILSADQFRSKPPPALTNGVYTRDYNEVKEVGDVNSTERPQDRANVARFFAAASPVQVWNRVAVQVRAAHRATLSEDARLFALLNMAIMDSTIAVFDTKYFYQTWRPVTAIWAADTDGNRRTERDTAFTPFIITPPFPGYPSAHATGSNAAVYVLQRLFGNRRRSITLSYPTLPDVILHYRNLRQITDDIDDARVYGGIHFRFDQEAGVVQGRDIGAYIYRHQLRCASASRCLLEGRDE